MAKGKTKGPAVMPVPAAPEPQGPRDDSADFLRWGCDRQIVGLREKIAEFAVKLLANPAYALEWADQYFAFAAQLEVRVILRDSCLAGASSADLAAMATERMLHGARFPARSTSMASNQMAMEKTAAWAAAVVEFKGYEFPKLDEGKVRGAAQWYPIQTELEASMAKALVPLAWIPIDDKAGCPDDDGIYGRSTKGGPAHTIRVGHVREAKALLAKVGIPTEPQD